MGSLYLILYVDDITFFGSSMEDIEALKTALSTRFEMTDMGKIQSIWGFASLETVPNRHLEIDQSRYLRGVLARFNIGRCQPLRYPLPTGADVHLVKFEGQASVADTKLYQSIIGSLLYIQIGTRPDISFAVPVWHSMHPTLRLSICDCKVYPGYLVGTVDAKLVYDGVDGDGLHGYTDPVWGDQTDDYHSTSGYVFILAGGAISWSSRKQRNCGTKYH